jgi:hypothetical protein
MCTLPPPPPPLLLLLPSPSPLLLLPPLLVSLAHDAGHHWAEGQLLVNADKAVVSHVKVLVPVHVAAAAAAAWVHKIQIGSCAS